MPTYKTSMSGLKGKSVTALCRFLMEEGADPKTRVEVYRRGNPEPALIVRSIEEGAKLMVNEKADKGPRFVKYTPFPSNRRAEFDAQ